MSEKLDLLISLHNQCVEKEKYMRCKQLALMRERNLFLEKCKKIEAVGNTYKWEEAGSDLLPQVYNALFQRQAEDSNSNSNPNLNPNPDPDANPPDEDTD